MTATRWLYAAGSAALAYVAVLIVLIAVRQPIPSQLNTLALLILGIGIGTAAHAVVTDRRIDRLEAEVRSLVAAVTAHFDARLDQHDDTTGEIIRQAQRVRATAKVQEPAATVPGLTPEVIEIGQRLARRIARD